MSVLISFIVADMLFLVMIPHAFISIIILYVVRTKSYRFRFISVPTDVFLIKKKLLSQNSNASMQYTWVIFHVGKITSIWYTSNNLYIYENCRTSTIPIIKSKCQTIKINDKFGIGILFDHLSMEQSAKCFASNPYIHIILMEKEFPSRIFVVVVCWSNIKIS